MTLRTTDCFDAVLNPFRSCSSRSSDFHRALGRPAHHLPSISFVDTCFYQCLIILYSFSYLGQCYARCNRMDGRKILLALARLRSRHRDYASGFSRGNPIEFACKNSNPSHPHRSSGSLGVKKCPSVMYPSALTVLRLYYDTRDSLKGV